MVWCGSGDTLRDTGAERGPLERLRTERSPFLVRCERLVAMQLSEMICRMLAVCFMCAWVRYIDKVAGPWGGVDQVATSGTLVCVQGS